MTLVVLRIEQGSDPNGHLDATSPVGVACLGPLHERSSVLSLCHSCDILVCVDLDVVVACLLRAHSGIVVRQLLLIQVLLPALSLLHFNSYFN